MATTFDFIDEDDIHTRQQITPEWDIFSLLVLIAIVVLDSVALYFVIERQSFLAILFHFAAMFCAWGLARIKEINEKDARFAWVTAISVPIMGPVAPIGVLLSLLWYFFSKEKSLTFRQWRDSIFPPDKKSLAEEVYERISFGRDQAGENYSVTYLMDVLNFGSDEKKREAIFQILRHYDPSFAPLLKMGLEDDHNAIRVQAATAITRLKTGYHNELVYLEKLYDEWPEKEDLMLELARHYDEYAFSGLLDEKYATEYQEAALFYYREFIKVKEEVEKDDAQAEAYALAARQLMARLLLRMGQLEEACEMYKDLRDRGHGTSESDIWYSECLFRLKRYKDLRELAEDSIEKLMQGNTQRFPDNVRGVMRLWGQPEERANI